MIRRERITQLAKKIRARDQEVEQAAANQAKFVHLLYSAIEETIGALHKEGINTLHLAEKEKLADGREQFSFVERDYRFVFVPYQGIAFPALDGCGLPDELAEALGQKRAGRLVLSYHPQEDPDAAKTLCSYYVFADGSWCACRAGDSEYLALDDQEIADHVLRLIELIQDGFRKHWHAHADLSLSATDATKPETRFQIPRVMDVSD